MDVSRSSNTFRMQLISVKRIRGTNGEEKGNEDYFASAEFARRCDARSKEGFNIIFWIGGKGDPRELP